MMLVMIAAGFWQIGRGGQKAALNAAWVQVQQQSPVTSDKIPVLSENERYQRVRLTGRFVNNRQFLLDNQVYHEGNVQAVGYAVLTPFETTHKEMILVNRGWVITGHDRQQLPVINIAESEQHIEGVLLQPSQGYRMGAMDADLRWPRVIQYIDIKALSARLQRVINPAVLVLDKNQIVAYRYNWKITEMDPEKHYSYAFQWFGMAFALVILLIMNLLKKRKRVIQHDNNA